MQTCNYFIQFILIRGADFVHVFQFVNDLGLWRLIRLMMNSKYFQKCFFVLYLLGQNSYDLPGKKYKVWLQHIPRLFSLIVAFTGICRHCGADRNQLKPVSLVMYIILAVAFLINALVVLEYFTVSNGVQKLNSAYVDAIDYLERKLFVNIDYDRFKRSFQCKLQIICWTCLLTFSIKIIFVSYGKIPASEIVLFLLYYLKQFTLVHILFHIEFVHFLMQTINLEFEPMNMNNQCEFTIKSIQPKAIELLHTLCHCKFIHFRVWKIIQVLNIRFGWILIALMLATLLDVSFSSYWIWAFVHQACHEHIEIHRFMRK